MKIDNEHMCPLIPTIAFGKRITKIREHVGLTMVKFAIQIEENHAWCVALEAGEIDPTINELKDIANALGVQIWGLFMPVAAPVYTLPPEPSEANISNHEREAYKAHIHEQKFRINELEQIIHKLLDKI